MLTTPFYRSTLLQPFQKTGSRVKRALARDDTVCSFVGVVSGLDGHFQKTESRLAGRDDIEYSLVDLLFGVTLPPFHLSTFPQKYRNL
ncbi:MAG TPA: hypothetical protein P5222_08590, partial [Candidatus Cloacimonadota bacterium]|nr:hypothetical protein [Candidatus Cloacimonadota bacterium]